MRDATRTACWILGGWTALIGWGGLATAADAPTPGSLSLADERATLRLIDPDLRINLVASEPDVSSPVAVAWDENGRLFVAEMTELSRRPQVGQDPAAGRPRRRR